MTADRMNTILTRLMIVNHINSSVLLPVNVNFREIIDEIFAFERKKGLPPRFLITSEIEPDCSIVSDAALVRIILENLIDNAIKFYNTSDRLNPFVKVKLTKQSSFVKVSVEDNGIGMNKETQKRIFEKFYRAHTGNVHNVKGFGLGLSYVKTMIDAHGGKIKVESATGKGTTFIIDMPLAEKKHISDR